MSNKDMVPIGKNSFGLFTMDAAKDYLEVSCTTLNESIKKGFLPEKYANKLLDMGSLAMLPIDDPPSERVIGIYGHRAIKALMRGDFIQTIAQASFGLQLMPMDWEDAAPKKLTALQRFYCELAWGLAWAKNPHSSELDAGLPALRRLHQKVRKHLKAHRIDHRSPDWHAWKYLSAMTLGAALCYFVMLLGHGWFCSEKQAMRLKTNPAYRQRLARRLVSHREELHDVRPLYGGHRHVTVRVAWNLLQLSALAQSEEAFLDALSVLYGKLYKTFPAVLAALEDDADTVVMLQLPKVAQFLLQKIEPEAA